MFKVLLKTIILLSIIALSYFGFYKYLDYQQKLKPITINGTIVPKAKNLPAFRLNNFSDTDLINKWSILYFGYTRCPDICPTTLKTLSQMSDMLDKQDYPVKPQIIFISLDTAFDNAEFADRYAKNFNQTFIGLADKRGNNTQIQPLTQVLGVVAEKVYLKQADSTDPSNYVLDHSSNLFIINPKGQLQALLSPPHKPQQLVHDYQAIVKKYN